MRLTKKQLDQLLHRDSKNWYHLLDKYFNRYDINTDNRVAGFMCQTLHESDYYKRLTENLNYSAKRLNEVFPKYFARAGRDARQYHRQPEKIANVVYANRIGNGGIDSGDGWRFRGGGLMQLTGKSNYLTFAEDIRMALDDAAEYVRTPKGAVHSACWFWKTNNLNQYCDNRDVVGLSKRVNGGTNGLEDRIVLWNKTLYMLQNGLSPYSFSNLSLGSSGAEVKKLQYLLKLKPDGVFGPATRKAVQNWQIQNGLTPDGIVGPKTYQRMQKLL